MDIRNSRHIRHQTFAHSVVRPGSGLVLARVPGDAWATPHPEAPMSYGQYLNRFCGAALYRQVEAARAETRPESGTTRTTQTTQTTTGSRRQDPARR